MSEWRFDVPGADSPESADTPSPAAALSSTSSAGDALRSARGQASQTPSDGGAVRVEVAVAFRGDGSAGSGRPKAGGEASSPPASPPGLSRAPRLLSLHGRMWQASPQPSPVTPGVGGGSLAQGERAEEQRWQLGDGAGQGSDSDSGEQADGPPASRAKEAAASTDWREFVTKPPLLPDWRQ
jgi:hypothetical protein